MNRMVVHTLGIVCLLISPLSATAAIIIDVGDHLLQPNMPDQTFQILVSGGDLVQGLNFYIQVADGGPEAGGSIDGPVIQELDILTGTIFDGNNTGAIDFDGGPPPYPDVVPQWEGHSTTTLSGSVAATGLLATVTIDTTGFGGGTWDLIMQNTGDGTYTTDFAGISADITDGSITVIPEPSTFVMSTGLIAMGLVGYGRRRRRALTST